MWGLPFNAHKYLVEKLSGTHASTMLMLRYIKFIQSIKKSPNLAVKFLYQKIHKNVNTVTGRNVAYILQATGFTEMEDINLWEVKKKVVFCETNPADEWKVDFIKEIVNIKHKVLVLDAVGGMCFDNDDLEDIVDYLCTSWQFPPNRIHLKIMYVIFC